MMVQGQSKNQGDVWDNWQIYVGLVAMTLGGHTAEPATQPVWIKLRSKPCGNFSADDSGLHNCCFDVN